MSGPRADPVDAFAECARSYCELVDSVDEIGRGELVWEAGARLARLYAAGYVLPDESPEGELVDSETTPAEKERKDELQHRLSQKLQGVDSYWLVHATPMTRQALIPRTSPSTSQPRSSRHIATCWSASGSRLRASRSRSAASSRTT